MLCSRPFHVASPILLTDLIVHLLDESNIPAAEIAQPNLALESLVSLLGTGWYRLKGLYEGPEARTLRVTFESDNSLVLLQAWDSTQQDSDLIALFQADAGTVPITFQVLDGASVGVTGVSISVWNSGLTTAVVPNVLTNGAGKVVVALPPGSYKAYYYKAYGSFSTQPDTFTVVTNVPQTITKSVVLSYPQLPTMGRVTLYGWVLTMEGTPVVGAEVKMKLLKTPQIQSSGAGLSKFEETVLTDQAGKFEFTPAAKSVITLTCNVTGYARTGTLPASGSLSWYDFAVETIA